MIFKALIVSDELSAASQIATPFNKDRSYYLETHSILLKKGAFNIQNFISISLIIYKFFIRK